MSDPFLDTPLPRKPLIAIAALVGFSLLLVIGAKLTGYNPSQVAPSPVVESRDIRFLDAADGTLIVADAGDRQQIAVLPSGNAGFVRGVLRAIARDRHSRHISMDTPFQVARLADGRLILRDLGSQRVIELNSFGPSNFGAFAAFLKDVAPAHTQSAQSGQASNAQ
jgi:putative photosynthetic complex assembly protein